MHARIILYKRITFEQVRRYHIWTNASRGRAATAMCRGALVRKPGKPVPISDNNFLGCHCTIRGNTNALALSMVICHGSPNVPADLVVTLHASCSLFHKGLSGIDRVGKMSVLRSMLQNDVGYRNVSLDKMQDRAGILYNTFFDF